MVAAPVQHDPVVEEQPEEAEIVVKKSKKRKKNYIKAQNAILVNMKKCGKRYQEKFPEAQLILLSRFPNKTSGCDISCQPH